MPQIHFSSLRFSLLPVVCLCFLAIAFLGGCSDQPNSDLTVDLPSQKQQTSVETASSNDPSEEDSASADETLVLSVEALIKSGEFESAEKSIRERLIVSPNSPRFVYLLARLESARGNLREASDLLDREDLQSSVNGGFRKQWSGLQIELSRSLGNFERLEKSLHRMIQQFPAETVWQHQLWEMLCSAGRTQEAGLVADVLAANGAASLPEIESLIFRGDAWPREIAEHLSPADQFETELARARWEFHQQNYVGAIDVLKKRFDAQQLAAVELAFYGKPLAELQSVSDLIRWHSQCGDDVKKYGDYWSALATYFLESHEDEAAIRCLLESISRNQSDPVAYARLGRALKNLGQPEVSKEAKRVATLLTWTRQTVDSWRLGERPLANAKQKEVMVVIKQLLKLGRAFEALQWSETWIRASGRDDDEAKAYLAGVLAQRRQLHANRDWPRQALVHSMLGLNPMNFRYDKAIKNLKQTKSPAVASSSSSFIVDQDTSFQWENVAHRCGLDFRWFMDVKNDLAKIPLYQSVGGGVGVIDFDLDGWPDLYFAQGSGSPPDLQGTRANALFHNREGEFVMIGKEASVEDFRYAQGIAVGDVNQDGFPDLYVANIGRNLLLVNNGDGTFQDATIDIDGVENTFTTSVAIADLNGDRLPDFYDANYIGLEKAFEPLTTNTEGHLLATGPLSHRSEADCWSLNLADNRFKVSKISPESIAPGTSLGIVVANLDGEGGNDVFVGNDARDNHFLVFDSKPKSESKDGGVEIRNVAALLGVASANDGFAKACMGIAVADFNGDQQLDMHVANFLHEADNLYVTTSRGGFVDASKRFGLSLPSASFLGFGSKAVDFNRDGWVDLVVTNGHVEDLRWKGDPFKMPPSVYRNIETQLVPADVVDPSDYARTPNLGRSLATLDFDRDHRPDFVITHLDHPAALLRNETETTNHWVQLELVGTQSERDAIGAELSVVTPSGIQSGWVTAGDGFLCSDEAVLDFGLGAENTISEVIIKWPSGIVSSYQNIAVDKRYLAIENASGLLAR